MSSAVLRLIKHPQNTAGQCPWPPRRVAKRSKTFFPRKTSIFKQKSSKNTLGQNGVVNNSVRDCSGGYRCFRVSKLREFDLSNVEATGYAFHEEILYHLRLTGARFGETPIIFTDRRYGQSKINMKEAFIALWIIFKLSIRRER